MAPHWCFINGSHLSAAVLPEIVGAKRKHWAPTCPRCEHVELHRSNSDLNQGGANISATEGTIKGFLFEYIYLNLFQCIFDNLKSGYVLEIK